jgi:microcystin-dependent protein
MASTYSTNLRTELIGAGEQAGTWGTTTNTTLGTILEQAVAGVSGGPCVGGTYPTVNFGTDADITLTANNGAIDQSRSAVLVVTSTGSLTATRNVIAPASASKLYVVKNSTSGGQSIQIKYATGTGVTIPNGQTYPVYGDGTNFYLASSNTTPTGTIQMWSTATAPIGYVLCNGAAISRTTFSNLFSVIGTTFGAGDGSTTFNTPNYTNRMPYGAAIGTTGGSTTITTNNLPSHTHTGTTNGQSVPHSHTYSGTTSGQSQSHHHFTLEPTAGTYQNVTADFGGAFTTAAYGSTLNGNLITGGASQDHNHTYSGTSANNSVDHNHGFTTDATGSGTAFLPPYLGINFIIKT